MLQYALVALWAMSHATHHPLPASSPAAVQGNWNLGKITTAAIKNWLDTPEAVANGLAARRDAELAVIRNANITFVVRWGCH